MNTFLMIARRSHLNKHVSIDERKVVPHIKAHDADVQFAVCALANRKYFVQDDDKLVTGG